MGAPQYVSKIAQAVFDLTPRFPGYSKMLRSWADSIEWSSSDPQKMNAMVFPAMDEIDDALMRYVNRIICAGTVQERLAGFLKLGCFSVWAATMVREHQCESEVQG